MTVEKAIAKVTKTLKVTPTLNKNNYSFQFGRNILSFYKNGSDNAICCINIRSVGDESDAMSDYSAGVFFENITQALKFINRSGR